MRIDERGGEGDHGCEALIRFVGAHGDPLELLEFAEEIFDEMTIFVKSLSMVRGVARRGCCDMTICAPRSFNSAMIQSLSKVSSASRAPNSPPSIKGATPTVSKRCPGRRTNRTRLPSASVNARILVVQPPLDLPMAITRTSHSGGCGLHRLFGLAQRCSACSATRVQTACPSWSPCAFKTVACSRARAGACPMCRRLSTSACISIAWSKDRLIR